MKRTNLVFAVSILLLVSAGACNATKQEATASQAQAAEGSISGKVVETMDSGGYTYVSLDRNGKKIWVAIPQTPVKVGQNITCQPGMEMKNFTSKTLKRTFESIIFSGGVL